MADAAPTRPKRRAKALPLPDCVALVLQGGGALGSYQAGVIEGLAASGIEIDWVAGISIGAINAAIVAGNPPERRVERLNIFWDTVTSALPSFPIFPDDRIREFLHEWSAGFVLAAGVPGFFKPRLVSPMFAAPGTPGAMSFYDTAPLEDLLDALVDWDLLNHGPVRLSVGAVDVESGNFSYFDTTETVIDARHIMASGALPPGLPPVEIDGRLWWDGGLVSNTPLTHVLDHQDGALLAFQVDLFSAATERPRTIMDVMAREKEIRFSSRTRQVSDQVMKVRKDRELARKVLAKLPPELADDPDVVALRNRSNEDPVNLVHLIYRANAWEGGSRDFEFSARTMREHWEAGQEAVAETMAHAQLVAENIETGKSAAFDLTVHRTPLP
ncbi:patatin-like phospholipase family protein [Sphingomonas sp. 10B4]|uniref:patatin-like phospholipase family protein n=1 Tax=Sphingomonas sp. 10B4 TaxID=3048575 RepID=UPI002AB34184|nr:patatin-like phospholipase family protein [Sphingomonas sp. 10B4]MDY7525029.1 patatin-like phospholipase family protein [Sphingomonas sp. 10B4]MEB0281532.1 patatin-like phospholipase family protein [Sphingomonas sp. 10B4]